MVAVLANVASASFGIFHSLKTPDLEMLVGFISGSESSTNAMLTYLHISTEGRIAASGLLIAATSRIGAGLASVISPAKF